MMELTLIPSGEFVMGAGCGFADEQPLTKVTIKNAFWMGTCEVTNEQFTRFDPAHDSRFESKNGYQFGVTGFALNEPKQPVVRVSWKQAMAFCQRSVYGSPTATNLHQVRRLDSPRQALRRPGISKC